MRERARLGAAEEAKRKAFRRSAEGRAQRERARRRYRDMPRAEAIALARAKFPDIFARPVWKAPEFPSGFSVDEFVNDRVFFVRTGRGYERNLVQTTLPSSAVNELGKRELVSTRLEASGDGFVPENTTAPVEIGRQASDPVRFKQDDVTFALVGAAATEAETSDDKAVYAEALKDTDHAVAATPNGVETFLQLRSPEAPEEARYRFDLPAGAQLRLTDNAIAGANDGAAVGAEVAKDGKPLLQVAPPVAKDADGQPVPVRYAIDGNDLIVKVDHRAGEFLYPILVDPWIGRMGSTGNPTFGFGRSNGGIIGHDCTWSPGCNSWTGFSGVGLYIQAQPGGYPSDWSAYGEFYYKAPHGSQIQRVDWNGWGHTWGNSCIFGQILDPTYGHVQSDELAHCGDGSGNKPIFTGGSPGNWARMVHVQYNGTWWNAWSFVRDPMVHLWEGANPYFNNPGVRAQDPAQWNEGARTTRWLKGGEVFRYQYNVHDDGLGLDWVDDNNFGRGSRSARTGACDNPAAATPCPRDYVIPENSATWAANDTADWPEGITPNWARTFDKVGNVSSNYNWNIKVDKTAPRLTVGGAIQQRENQTAAAGNYDLTFTAEDGTTASPSTQRSGVKSMNIQFIDPLGTVRFSSPKNPECGGSCSESDRVEFDTNKYATQYGFGTWTFRVRAHDQLGHGDSRDIKVTFTRPADYDDCMEQVDRETGEVPDAAFCGSHTRHELEPLPLLDEPTETPDEEVNCPGCGPEETPNPSARLDAPEDPNDVFYKELNPSAITRYGIAERFTQDPARFGQPGDWYSSTLKSPAFHELNAQNRVNRLRWHVPWNVFELGDDNPTKRGFRAGCRDAAANVDPVTGAPEPIEMTVSFEVGLTADSKNLKIPSSELRDFPKRYRAATARALKYLCPNVVKYVGPWNEPNYASQYPVSKNAALAAKLTAVMREYNCKPEKGCHVISAEFAGFGNTPRAVDAVDEYVQTYIAKLKVYSDEYGNAMPKLWGFHPYADITNADLSNPDPEAWSKAAPHTTKFFNRLKNHDAVPKGGSVWLTEAGSRRDVKRAGGNYPAGFPDNDGDEHAKEVKWLLTKLAPKQFDAAGKVKRPAVARVYYYSFCGPNTVGQWDSALMDTSDCVDSAVPTQKRPAWGEFDRVVNPPPQP